MADKKIQYVAVPEEAPKMSVSLVARTIFYLVAIVNAVCVYFGVDFHITADYAGLYEGLSALVAVVAFGHATWKNQDFTKKARIKSEVAKQVAIEPKKKKGGE